MTYFCICKCHRTCHRCGLPFTGPNDYHQNCGDTTSGTQGSYTIPNRNEPWSDDE
jgi:hypothetical protein